eukprot:g22185.t1
MRVMRVVRALRSIRVMRLLRFVSSLRTLVLSIISSLASLVWTAVLFMMIFYVFGAVLAQLTLDWCRAKSIELSQDPAALPQCPHELRIFGGVSESMLTLFLTVSGGMDWRDALMPLRRVSPVAAVALVMYILLTVFAVVNVVTGVFVNTAIETAMNDKDLAAMKQIQRRDP